MSQLPEEITNRPTALITGGSAGVGLATAKRLAEQGYNIMICGRNQQRLDDALDQIQMVDPTPMSIIACRCDLSEPGAAQSLAQVAIEKLGKVDVLVNNAALAPLSPLEAISDDDFENTVQVNIKSVFYLTREVWKQMKGQGSGTIINISSLAAIDPFPGFSLYGSTKAWIDLMTTALAAEGKEQGIRVYSIRPGAVETDMLRGLFPEFPKEQCVSPDEVAEKIWDCIRDPEQFESGQHFAVTRQTEA